MTRVFSSFQDVPRAPYLVTVGTFDGVHLGHQHLLRQARARAGEIGASMLIVTFEPIPAMVLRPESFSGRLTTAERKIALLLEDPDVTAVVLPFTHDLSRLSAREFLGELATTIDTREMWVGEAFALGRNREGTIDALTEICRDLGFNITAVPRVELAGGVVSSSRIRQLVCEGNVADAARLLGRRFTVDGQVREGAKLGRTIGFPTANVHPAEDLVCLADGIYASFASIDDEDVLRPAMTYIGTRPALNPGERVIETHLFDFDQDIYGRQLTTAFVERLRPDSNFESVDALIEQMKIDEQRSRALLAVPVM